LLRFDLVESFDVIQTLGDHIGFQLFSVGTKLLDYLEEQREAHAVDVVVQGKVKSLEDHAFVDKSDNNLILLLETLKHVETHLKSRGIILPVRLGILSLFAADVNENSCKLQRVV